MRPRKEALCCLLVILVTFVSVGSGLQTVRGSTLSGEQGQPDDEYQPVPGQGNATNGLTANETAALFSRDQDRTTINEGESAFRELTTYTDIDYTRPPNMAARWSRADYQDIPHGGENESIYPPHATLKDSGAIKDAHVTVFGVHPSTWLHAGQTKGPWYIAPEGTVRALVDYRLEDSRTNDTDWGNHSTEYRVLEYEADRSRIETVTLSIGDASWTTNGTHMPTLSYATNANGSAGLSMQAQITAWSTVTVTEYRCANTTNTTGPCNLTSSTRQYTDRDSGTVTQETNSVQVYGYATTPRHYTFPNGDEAALVNIDGPWHNIVLAGNGSKRVRGVWRYYTQRDARWDTLVYNTTDGQETKQSPARPAFVHAFPAIFGPESRPRAIDVQSDGVTGSDPSGSIHQYVNVHTVEGEYTTTYTLTARYRAIQEDALEVQGIVRGTTIEIEDVQREQIRESELTVSTVTRFDNGSVRLKVVLQDAQSGRPIMLASSPFIGQDRTGYIRVADQVVTTDVNGEASVVVDSTGTYVARYHPGSWIANDPAYTGAVDRAKYVQIIDDDLVSVDGEHPYRLYTVTPAGHDLINDTPRSGIEFGHGAGDLGESSQDVAAVELGNRYIEQEHVTNPGSPVEKAVSYYKLDDGRRLDAVGLDDEGDIVVTLEAERVNHDVRTGVPADYDTMVDCEPEAAIWVAMSRQEGHTVLDALN
jgi:hypothetical protein